MGPGRPRPGSVASADGQTDVGDVQAERVGEPDAVVQFLAEPLSVARLHQRPDHLPRLRPPEDVLGEDWEHRVRRVHEPGAHLLPGGPEQHPFVRHAGAVVDSVVDREAVAEILEHGPARRARDQSEAGDDQPLEEDLHQEDLLLEQVRLEEHVRDLVEVRVALPLPTDLPDQPQPRLGVTRLVLHHRRVVEPRLRIGPRGQLLRDVEAPGRYLVVDRWESADAYNAFVAERREEYMERVDAAGFHYDNELRFGTFENVWS